MKSGRGCGDGRGRGNRGGKGNKPFNKEWCKYKECLNCHKNVHPSTTFPEEEEEDDEASRSYRSSQAKSVTNITKDFNKIKNPLHSCNSYRSQTPTYLITTMRKKLRTSRFQAADSH